MKRSIDKKIVTDGVHVVGIEVYDPEQVEQMIADYKEAIEAINGVLYGYCTIKQVHERFNKLKEVVEKYYGKPWKKIRQEIDNG